MAPRRVKCLFGDAEMLRCCRGRVRVSGTASARDAAVAPKAGSGTLEAVEGITRARARARARVKPSPPFTSSGSLDSANYRQRRSHRRHRPQRRKPRTNHRHPDLPEDAQPGETWALPTRVAKDFLQVRLRMRPPAVQNGREETKPWFPGPPSRAGLTPSVNSSCSLALTPYFFFPPPGSPDPEMRPRLH